MYHIQVREPAQNNGEWKDEGTVYEDYETSAAILRADETLFKQGKECRVIRRNPMGQIAVIAERLFAKEI